MGVCSYLPGTARRVRICAAALITACALVFTAGVPEQALAGQGGGTLSASQRLVLHSIAADTWKFYAADVASDGDLKCEDDGPSTDTRPSDMMLDHLRAFAAYDTSHDWAKVVTRTQAVISEFTAKYSSANSLTDTCLA